MVTRYPAEVKQVSWCSGPGGETRKVEDPILKMTTGRVVEGKIVLEGEPLSEGAVVTVVARDGDDTFDVTPEAERALLEAMAQAERGQVVSWETLRDRLRRVP